MICKNCGKEHDGHYGSGIFCSIECKQRYNISKSDKPHICKFCGKEFKSSVSLGGHIVSCKKNPNGGIGRKKAQITVNEKFDKINPFETYTIKCLVCGSHFSIVVRKNDFEKGKFRHTCSDKCAHIRDLSDESRIKISESIKKHINEFGMVGCVQKGSEPILLKCVCEQCGKEFEVWNKRIYNGENLVNGFYSKRFCSKECSSIHRSSVCSIKTKSRCDAGTFGGKNNDTFKKHKHGWYKGLYCGSSWELAFVIYHIDHGYDVKRCDLVLQYEYNGKTYNYYPDYQIGTDIYEVKGFEDFKAKAKHKKYPYIKWFDRDKMKPILKYVIEKYGKNFVELLNYKQSLGE